jgi:hypothetical protein
MFEEVNKFFNNPGPTGESPTDRQKQIFREELNRIYTTSPKVLTSLNKLYGKPVNSQNVTEEKI